MANKDYYKVLGVEKNATEKDIKMAYRKLAMKYHPDKLKDGTSDEKMQELNEAYEVLSDPKKRAEYDRFGAGGAQAGEFNMRMGDFGGAGGGFGMSFQDIFSDIFSSFSGGYKRSSGGGASHNASATMKRRGADIYTNVVISFDAAISGTEFKEKYVKYDICPKCQGEGATAQDVKPCARCNSTGKERIRKQTPFGIAEVVSNCSGCAGSGKIVTKPCPTCNGSRYVKKEKPVTIKISPGFDTGDKVKLPGYGEKGINGGPSGDMYVVVNVKPHLFYVRNGLDLLIKQFPVSFLDIVKGNDVLVPTPNGIQAVPMKPTYNSGTKIRVKGGGIQNKAGSKGDLLLILDVKIPNYTQEEFAEMAKKLEHFSDDVNKKFVKQFRKNK
ncbi:DnaJ C-terminal domain-containing protein [Mycoplasmopsis primatum]|uniref:DnaJ C-terminal domain-containing protein n=1 Tax=Mycoplasmopsis primatum TaxID=55604 RepID=UPI0004950FF6|nr:DnaJ C-terminal domain-containing protein [Mycoplasmopsis primatum]